MDLPSPHLVTRRGALTFAGVAALGLSACGGDSDADSTSAKGGGGKTRTVTGTYGKVEVPARPQRIVLLSATTLLEIPGIPVVGMADDPYYTKSIGSDLRKVYDDITKLGSAEELDLEKIAAATPDVIVYGTPQPVVERNKQVLKDLAKIAPTVYVGPKFPNDRLDQYPQLADAINQKAAAEKVIGDTKEYGKKIAARHADLLKGKTAVAVVTWDDAGEVAIGHSSDWDALVPQMAGISFKKTKEFGGTMSHERAARALGGADLIIIGGSGRDGKLPPSTTSFTGSRLFQQLPAVKAERIITTREGGDRSWTVARENLEIIDRALSKMS